MPPTEQALLDIQASLKTLNGLPDRLSAIERAAGEGATRIDDVTKAVAELRKSSLALRSAVNTSYGARLAAYPHLNGFSPEAAAQLGARFVLNAIAQGKTAGWNSDVREKVLGETCDLLGVTQKAALTSTDIPLPTEYASQIVELVYQYGTARKVCTVIPLGATTVKLPRLKAGEPTFGFIATSGSVTEKSPQIEFVTFSPGKAGGIVRVPSEIDADSIVPLGAFIGRYIAREMALLEDKCLFASDGTSTYNSITGMGVQSDNDSYTYTTSTGNTAPSNITLANLRALRAKPSGAVLGNAKYYMHPTMENLMVSFNTSATVTPYLRGNQAGNVGATLDGFPIVWVPAMPVYTTSATVSAYQVYFGDGSYWYFGQRMGISIEQSRDVYFATDEVGIRALERFDIEQMGKQSTAALKLAAS